MRTRRLTSPWPFLFSVTARSLVQNLPPAEKRKPRARLKRVPSSDKWIQEVIL